ncbi:MAG: Peptidase, M23/M37 family, partial [uncultured Acidimicrobiales bacterium]
GRTGDDIAVGRGGGHHRAGRRRPHQGARAPADARPRSSGHLTVRLPDPSDLRHLEAAHRHRLRRRLGHPDPGFGRRRRRQRRLVRRLRQRHDHRPRRGNRHPVRAPVDHLGVGGRQGHARPDHRTGGLHRRLHRTSRPLRGPCQRRPCEPGELFL